MEVFELRDTLIGDYSSYVSSFIKIQNNRINTYVEQSIQDGLLWPVPLIQLNPSFEPGSWIDDLTTQGVLHPECANIFRPITSNQPSFNKRPKYAHRISPILLCHALRL